MSDGFQPVYRTMEAELHDQPASTRRRFVASTAAAVAGAGILGALPARALATHNDVQTILNVAASAEVLATIVNTVGWQRGLGGDAVTQRNIAAAAQEELRHYDVLASLGGVPASTKIWIPNAVFASRSSLLETLVVGDQIFVNAYLIGVACFARKAPAKLAAVPAEFMGAEAVHRALALQSLGRLGNDRIFMRVEFTDILEAVNQLKAAGFGFGETGTMPGRFFNFETVRKDTPTVAGVNTPNITPIDCH